MGFIATEIIRKPQRANLEMIFLLVLQNFDAVAKIFRSVFFPVSKAVFRTLSKIECFAKIANGLAVSYFCKMLHLTCLTEF